ncbi:MAG: exodeoxyribonuclease V subunit alpha [Proteobacteria bacterium]|nr:exodeoxyribonuclease V subunit alpha [Pseudomonadota bacterium]MBU1057464.1 exodeoxyribonuclease V subunit alpha [Pseudomonadota bacterium]
MEEQKLRLLDSQFAKFLARRSALSGSAREQFAALICKLSMSLAAGDSCLPLTGTEEALVGRSGLAGTGANPLILWQNRLYLEKIFAYESRLAENIKRLVANASPLLMDVTLLKTLFGEDAAGEVDWQRISAERALEQNFLIICGGPGTGKTSTVVKILALLLSVRGPGLRIGLAAPTGKAAMRLQESIADSIHHLALSDPVRARIPTQAHTLHRLLGVRRLSPFFFHHAQNPLPYDVVVVDEASMVDLALMSKLVAALRPESRLILLGDRNQLASVESGAVLADLIAALPENTVELQKSYRFDGGIKGFAEAINGGDSSRAWQIMAGQEPENVSLLEEEVADYGGEKYCRYMEAVRQARTVEEYGQLFSFLHSFKILCALRNGPAGVTGINAQVERFLSARGYDCFASAWYRGRPVMVTRNDYALDLYNGDIGICLPDPERPETMKVWFERPDATLQGLLPGRLSSCETVYALTIHKSQGTEIDEVLVVLPEHDSVLITRELLYTAVTRAAKRVRLRGKRAVFDTAVSRKIERFSGLALRLRE